MKLEESIDLERSPIEQILELGQLYVEPCHEGAAAVQVFETVLRRDPENSRAKLWLAYCSLHYLMDERSLLRAQDLLNSIIDSDSHYAGAALILLADVLRDLDFSFDREPSISERIKLLETAVALKPDWVNNHLNLSIAYKKVGRLSEAIVQLRQAIANVKPLDSDWDLAEKCFESCITGRYSLTKYMSANLEDMLRKQSQPDTPSHQQKQ